MDLSGLSDRKTMLFVKGLIENEGEWLLVRRSETAPRRALEWDFPGGEADDHDNPVAEVQREVQEETGLAVSNIELKYATTRSIADRKVIFLFYTMQSDDRDVELSYEHDQSTWVSAQELPQLNTFELHQEAVRFIFDITL